MWPNISSSHISMLFQVLLLFSTLWGNPTQWRGFRTLRRCWPRSFRCWNHLEPCSWGHRGVPSHANSWSLSWQKRGNEPKPVRRNIIGSWTFIRQSFHMINDVRVGHAVAKLNNTFVNDAALVSRNVFPRSNSTFCDQQIALSQWTKQCRAQTLPRRHVGSACNRATNYLKNSFPSPSSSWRWEEKEVHGERGGGDKPSGQYRSRCRKSLAKLLCIFGYL